MIWNYILIIGCIVFSAFFSGSEMAFTSANRMRLSHKAEKRPVVGHIALDIYDNFEKALVSILAGNNLVNIAASSVGTVIAISLMGEGGAWVATAVMTLLILTFGEIIPKIIANQRPEAFSLDVSLPLRVWMTVLWPITFILNKLLILVSKMWGRAAKRNYTMTEDDFETVLETVEDEGVVDEDTCELLQSALDFDDVLAYEVITPRVDMVALDIEDERDELIKTALSSPFTRLPVYEDTPDNIIGVLHLNHLFKQMVKDENVDLRSVLMKPVFVHKTTALPDVLSTMRKEKSHMVIVTDEYGGTMGILTMEDVLEQLVGDIWDESDEIVDEFIEISPNVYEVDGDMRLADFMAEFDKDDEEDEDDNATVGGWAVEQLGGYPKLHESFVFEDLKVTITRKQNLRVIRLTVEQDPNWVEEPEEEDEEENLPL
ncbi:MAG TPA: hemolysin family protein [Clostridia bacterium]|nr:hemolysin family protein [Clostridia bacterium]